ncbi:deoxyuridine 5'-triphosphate nucleotidohydrolase, mitochondrial isoform X2 [Carassius auratus]|uniref:Deoxyuridine 5'-triphosphate nucleotidohydrolase, mitochondrial isoform X2 n=1 Tax=Carassius auratus TaxID=7957 RepID=A0A6P6RBQ2_CARAU|nr:deoxyuridine 5'-triphosphate nucleotidohydrolase, mitochondrial isoform X2 [Carassius auratus]
MMKFADSGMTINPIKLTKSLNKALGEIHSAKTLRDGNLIIICKDEKQQKKALSITSMLGLLVSCTLMKKKPWVRGVITGIPTDVNTDKIKSCVEGAKVVGAKRLQYVKNKERMDSLSVMLQFDEERMPERVKIGYVSYPVRPYVPPPLRCFKCQKYGHVSAVCRGKQRCARCGGDHEYGKCGEGVKAKCCNCGVLHTPVQSVAVNAPKSWFAIRHKKVKEEEEELPECEQQQIWRNDLQLKMLAWRVSVAAAVRGLNGFGVGCGAGGQQLHNNTTKREITANNGPPRSTSAAVTGSFRTCRPSYE